jgi:predicted DNA-binding transcriptional regulator YafY
MAKTQTGMKSGRNQKSAQVQKPQKAGKGKQDVETLRRRWDAILDIVGNWQEIRRGYASLVDKDLPTAPDIAFVLDKRGFHVDERTVRNNTKKHHIAFGTPSVVYNKQLLGYEIIEAPASPTQKPVIAKSSTPFLRKSGLERKLHGELYEAAEDAIKIDYPLTDPKSFSSLQNALTAIPLPQPNLVEYHKFTEVIPVIWKAFVEKKLLSITYTNQNNAVSRDRIIEPHALFVSENIWYVRAYCHYRQGVISLAIHRMHSPRILEESFVRSPAIIAEINSGKCFNYDRFDNVVLEVKTELVKVIGERDWFKGMSEGETKHLFDGDTRLEVKFNWVYDRPLIRWILAHAGKIVVKNPSVLRDKIREYGQAIVDAHAAGNPAFAHLKPKP